MTAKYAEKVERKIEGLAWLIKSESINYDWVSEEMLIIRGRITFLDNSILDFRELVTLRESDYRFQYMDQRGELIRRWDTAPHHRGIRTFPYHVHTQEGVGASRKMNLIRVLDELASLVVKNLENL